MLKSRFYLPLQFLAGTVVDDYSVRPFPFGRIGQMALQTQGGSFAVNRAARHNTRGALLGAVLYVLLC